MSEITMTFDNGPWREHSPGVLDTLARHEVPATFFVVGQQVPAALDVLERAVEEGHWIGNHTFTHTTTLGRFTDWNDALAEVVDTQEAIGELAHPDRLMRPFADGGFMDTRVLNQRVFDHFREERFTVVLWNVVPRDWEGPEWVERALEMVQQRDWSLLVIHDHHVTESTLDRFLTEARHAGFSFRQDFPPECVPLRRGEVQWPMEHLVAQTPVAA